MGTFRRILAALGISAGIYSIAAWAFGPLPLAHTVITITAIDHWHPNWPDATTVDDIASALPAQTAILAITLLVAYIGAGFIHRWITPPELPPHLSQAATLPAARAGRVLPLYTPTREQFHAELAGTLRDAGLTPDKALATADAAMLTADSDKPADWAGRVRKEAFNIAGLTIPHTRVVSREPHLAETALFLQEYGYRALLMKRVGQGIALLDDEDDYLNFDGLLVFYRTSAHAAESALLELLITTHQAHMASMDDNGERDKGDAVERNAKALKHVCTKLALRGFVPPELDAEVGRDGTATAEELERWAVAQVVASCSPMTRMPLPTVERTTVATGSGGADE